VIVKPNYEGTSKGIHQNSVVTNTKELQELVLSLWNQFHEPVLCEEYIEGSEYTVGILGNQTLKVLGPLEIKFKESSKKYPVYSFEAKQSNNNPYCDFICPAPMSKELERKIHHFSKKVFKLLACRDIARVDFRVNAKNEVFFLEINPLPGLSPGFSDLVIMAEKTGLPYDLLIKRILTPAIQRWRNLGNTKLV
jgi:D-alanine-D-alanine ligase